MKQIIVIIFTIFISVFSACKAGEAKSENSTPDVQTVIKVGTQATESAVDFTPYGLWEFVESKVIGDDGIEEILCIPEFEWLKPTLTIFPASRMEANFYGTYFGQLIKIDVYNYEFVNVELHSEGFIDQIEGPSTLQYTPETKQMRFIIRDGIHYFTFKE
jgi:hypothetical protein